MASSSSASPSPSITSVSSLLLPEMPYAMVLKGEHLVLAQRGSTGSVLFYTTANSDSSSPRASSSSSASTSSSDSGLKKQGELETKQVVRSLAVAAFHGTSYLFCGHSSSLSIWSVSPKVDYGLTRSLPSAVRHLLVCRTSLIATSGGSVCVFDINATANEFAIDGPKLGLPHDEDITGMVVDSTKNYLITVCRGSEIRIWNMSTGFVIDQRRSFPDLGPAVAIATSGKAFFVAFESGSIVGYELAPEKNSRPELLVDLGEYKLNEPLGEQVTLAMNTPTQLLIGKANGIIELLDWPSKKIVFSANAHSNAAVRGLLVANNRLLSIGDDRMLKIWQPTRDTNFVGNKTVETPIKPPSKEEKPSPSASRSPQLLAVKKHAFDGAAGTWRRESISAGSVSGPLNKLSHPSSSSKKSSEEETSSFTLENDGTRGRMRRKSIFQDATAGSPLLGQPSQLPLPAVTVGAKYRKFDERGSFTRFPGLSFICFLQGRHEAKWDKFFQYCRNLPTLNRYIAFLPASSYHMIIKNYETANVAGEEWFEKVLRSHESLSKMKAACSQANLSPSAGVGAVTLRSVLSVHLEPSPSPAVQALINTLVSLGVPPEPNFKFHLTLGYRFNYSDPSSSELSQLEAERLLVEKELLSVVGSKKELPFESCKLVYFPDMTRFDPI